MYPILVTITGSIGAGKTTLLKSVSKNENIVCVEEEIDKWKVVQSTNLLEEYTKYKRRCMEFQLHIIKNINQLFVDVIHRTKGKQIILTDRGNEDPHKVFIPAMLQCEKIDNIQAEILTQTSIFMSDKYIPQYYIYLKSSPEKCIERISRRGRHEEFEMDMNYIKLLCSLYDNWLLPLDNSFCIDVDNLTKQQVVMKCMEILNEIKYRN